MRIGSLFSGIGGLELGLERAGLGHTVWQVEIDPFCRRVLARHWPNVTRYADIVGLKGLEQVDIVCGGFPCQDVSSAGKRTGMSGAKSGLWSEYRRILEELRPRFAIVENVTSGKKLWLPRVISDIESIGYRSRAFALSASDVGAPHLRRRVFVLATSDSHGMGSQRTHGTCPNEPREHGESGGVRDTNRDGKSACAIDGEVARLRGMASMPSHWTASPELRGMAHGIPGRLDRLRALGNAVVPQCAEVIGNILREHIALHG